MIVYDLKTVVYATHYLGIKHCCGHLIYGLSGDLGRLLCMCNIQLSVLFLLAKMVPRQLLKLVYVILILLECTLVFLVGQTTFG